MNRGIARNLILAGLWAAYLPFVLFSYLLAWLDRKIGFPLSFPRDIDELAKKQQWCLKELKKSGALPQEAKIENYRVIPFTQEYIFRSNAGIIEIVYNEEGESKTLKYFVKFAPTMGTVWNRTIFNLQMNHIKEIFFNKYFINIEENIPAPKAYVAKLTLLTGNLCLITELMDDCIEYKEGTNDDFPAAHLELVLEGMATLHAQFWRENSKRMKRVIPIMQSTVDLFDSMVAFKWSVPARKILVKSWNMMNAHETVIHGDARVGNMLFPSREGKGHFVFIDWQAVRRGKAVFDLAYFMVLSLTPDYRKNHEQQALEDYYNKLIAKGVREYSREEMMEDYRHACLCLLVLLSLPMLSGEASVEGVGALIFAYGMNMWRERMQIMFSEFDYTWLATNYNVTEQEGRDAITEMLTVIENRLARINKKNAQAA